MILCIEDVGCRYITAFIDFGILFIDKLFIFFQQIFKLLQNLILIRLWFSQSIVFHRKGIHALEVAYAIFSNIKSLLLLAYNRIYHRDLLFLVELVRFFWRRHSQRANIRWYDWRWLNFFLMLHKGIKFIEKRIRKRRRLIRLMICVLFWQIVMNNRRYLFFWYVFLLNSKKMAKLFDCDLSLRKILEDMIDNHFSYLFACKLVDICGKKHLAELCLVDRIVLICVELMEKCNWIGMSGDMLYQFKNANLDYFLFHFFLSYFLLFLPCFIALVIILRGNMYYFFQI